MPNPVGSKAKRAELRRQRDLFLAARYPGNVDLAFMFLHVTEKALPCALTGLDIAEKAMRARKVLDYLDGVYRFKFSEAEYYDAAVEAEGEALAAWDVWKGEAP